MPSAPPDSSAYRLPSSIWRVVGGIKKRWNQHGRASNGIWPSCALQWRRLIVRQIAESAWVATGRLSYGRAHSQIPKTTLMPPCPNGQGVATANAVAYATGLVEVTLRSNPIGKGAKNGDSRSRRDRSALETRDAALSSVVAGVLMAYSLWRIDQLEAGRFALLMGAGVVIGLAAFVCAAFRCAAQAVVRLGFGVPSVASPRTPGTFGSRR